MTELESRLIGLLIVVIDTPRGKRFLWSRGYSEYTSDVLNRPYYALNEEVSVYRAGERIQHGSIEWVGTHGAYPCFHGLIPGREYAGQLLAEEYELGDIIAIESWKHKIPYGNFRELYWSALLQIADINTTGFYLTPEETEQLRPRSLQSQHTEQDNEPKTSSQL